MYALKRPLNSPPPAPPLADPSQFSPSQDVHRRMRHRPAQRQSHHRAIALETTVKLTMNLGLSAVALSALVHLIPHQFSQHARLQELQVASKVSNDRLRNVENNFQHYFDPYQSRAIMAEQTNRVDPKEKTIVLQRPSTASLGYQVSNWQDLAQQRVERSATGY
jgi:hypothetical protein